MEISELKNRTSEIKHLPSYPLPQLLRDLAPARQSNLLSLSGKTQDILFIPKCPEQVPIPRPCQILFLLPQVSFPEVTAASSSNTLILTHVTPSHSLPPSLKSIFFIGLCNAWRYVINIFTYVLCVSMPHSEPFPATHKQVRSLGAVLPLFIAGSPGPATLEGVGPKHRTRYSTSGMCRSKLLWNSTFYPVNWQKWKGWQYPLGEDTVVQPLWKSIWWH